MAKRTEAEQATLSFKDRSLSKAAAGQLLAFQPSDNLSVLIDRAVVRIKLAKTVKAEEATNEHFQRRDLRVNLRSGQFETRAAATTTGSFTNGIKAREVA